jgi:hypothetical protein
VLVQFGMLAGGAFGPGIILHERLRVVEPRGEAPNAIGIIEQPGLDVIEANTFDPRRSALQIVRLFAVELVERPF